MSHRLAVCTAVACLLVVGALFVLGFLREQRRSAAAIAAAKPLLFPEDVQ